MVSYALVDNIIDDLALKNLLNRLGPNCIRKRLGKTTKILRYKVRTRTSLVASTSIVIRLSFIPSEPRIMIRKDFDC